MALKNYPVYEKNPFKVDNIIRVRKSVVGGKLTFESEKGSVVKEIDLREERDYIQYDNEKYVKVFTRNLKGVSKFTIPMLKVFCYMATVTKPNKPNITIHMDECKEFCGYTNRVNVYKGIEGLLEANAIARKTGELEFFINPNVFYNGSRRGIMGGNENHQKS